MQITDELRETGWTAVDELVAASLTVFDRLASEQGSVDIVDQERLGDAIKALISGRPAAPPTPITKRRDGSMGEAYGRLYDELVTANRSNAALREALAALMRLFVQVARSAGYDESVIAEETASARAALEEQP